MDYNICNPVLPDSFLPLPGDTSPGVSHDSAQNPVAAFIPYYLFKAVHIAKGHRRERQELPRGGGQIRSLTI